MSFWIRNSIIGVLLAITAYVLLVNQGWLEIITNNVNTESAAVTQQPSSIVPKEAIIKEPTKTEIVKVTKEEKKLNNAAANGLSKFYANINPDLNENGPQIRNNIVYLPLPKGNIRDILVNKDKITQPLRKQWTGSVESRAFRNGETLFQKLSEYSTREGIEVLWWLNRDFIIKDPFRINKDLVSTAQIIGLSVDGHFIEGVKTYFCYSNKTFVLTDTENSYLESSCSKLTED